MSSSPLPLPLRVCQVVPSLAERDGGPSKSVRALALAQAAVGLDVTLLSTHPSAASTTSSGGCRVHVSLRNFPERLRASRGLNLDLRNGEFDLIHHHALWLRTLHYARVQARAAQVPLVISPRGMMSEWAWKHHGWRKQISRHLVHPRAFESAAGWHATSAEEAADIRGRGFSQPVCVAPNGVAAPTEDQRATAIAYWQQACPEVTVRPTALFYSRLHRKKRVVELIDLWLEQASPEWLLLIVGLPEDYSPDQLEAYVMRASGGGRVRVFNGEGLPAPYAVASLFLLPSHSENFGLVIAEAMASGVPVVVTDATPWSAINQNDAGWCVSWDRYPAALRAALGETAEQRAARGAIAREWVLRDFSWEQSARTLAAFYRQLCADRPSRHPAKL